VRRALLLIALAALLVPPAAAAHPLGNFTVNRHAAIELSGSAVYVHYVVDLAEIPTFQEGDRLRRAEFAREAGRRLELRLDGERVLLRVLARKVSERPGAGDLPTLRFEAVYEAQEVSAADGARTLVFNDGNFRERIGWREVVARASDGASIEASNVPGTSRSDALRRYPNKLLQSPLDVRSARVSFEPGDRPGKPPALGAARAADERDAGGFEALVAQGDLSAGVVLVSLALAMFWGAAHALTPGHGKAIVAGYLVGTRGRARDALALGGIVTATHTAGVFALALVTLVLSRFVVPERLYPWLTLASGLLVVGVGASVLAQRLRRSRSAHQHRRHHHHHHHHHHDHPGARGLVGVGVAAGVLPCPSALVVLLSAIALHRVGFGLALVVAFSLGLALTISSIGLVAIFARRAFGRLRFDGPLVRALPVASALLIVAVGLGLTVNAIPEVF
jgi:nickel/cobalt exporter